MVQIKSPFEIYNHLEKSNCGLCLQQSCMAFAASVFKGMKKLSDCPRLESETIARLNSGLPENKDPAEEQARHFEPLKIKIRSLDFASTAQKIGAQYIEDRLIIKCLGKDFFVDHSAEVSSECHINTWVQAPILNYVANSAGKTPAGEWVNFGKLQQARAWDQFFAKRCEEPFKRIIDRHTDLFFDLIEMFDTGQVLGFESADKAILLHPLPKLPFLICYWPAEDDLDSKLNIFFDQTAETNINIESIYLLGTGMVEMFQKIIRTHGNH